MPILVLWRNIDFQHCAIQNPAEESWFELTGTVLKDTPLQKIVSPEGGCAYINLVRENPEAFDKALQKRNAKAAPHPDCLRRCAQGRDCQSQACRRRAMSSKNRSGQRCGDDAAQKTDVASRRFKSACEAEDEERKLKAEQNALSVLPNIACRMYPKARMKMKIGKCVWSARRGCQPRRRISKSAKRWSDGLGKRLCRARVLLCCARGCDWSTLWGDSCSTAASEFGYGNKPARNCAR